MNYEKIQGWISDNEAGRLIGYATEAPTKNFLEIGSLYGKSASALAEVGKVTCVDLFPEEQLEKFKENTASLNVEILQGDSTKILPTLKEKYGLIFIDGNHTREYFEQDLNNSWNLLEDNGIIVIHDYNNDKWQDVKKVVQEFMVKHETPFHNQFGSANLVALKKCFKN